MKDKYILRNCVRSWRLLRGLTQKQLAERIGVRRETISLIEKGDFHLTSIKYGFMLGEVLGCYVTDLFWLESVEDEEKEH